MSRKQCVVLTIFMSEHRSFALGVFQGINGKATMNKMWVEVTNLLNTHGPPKTAEQWKRVRSSQIAGI